MLILTGSKQHILMRNSQWYCEKRRRGIVGFGGHVPAASFHFDNAPFQFGRVF